MKKIKKINPEISEVSAILRGAERNMLKKQLDELDNKFVSIEYLFKNGGMINSSGILTKERALDGDKALEIYVIRNKLQIKIISGMPLSSLAKIDNSLFIFQFNDVHNIKYSNDFPLITLIF